MYENINKNNSVKIVDTTLRDGEETAGVVFTNDEKIQIAKLLDEIGVDEIEAGIPVMGGDEKKAIKEIVNMKLKTKIIGWNRAVKKDIDASLDCGVDAVCISMPSSDLHIKYKLDKSKKWVLSNLAVTIDYAKSHGLYVIASAEDASRVDMFFLHEFIKTAKEAGANRFRFCDTIGIMSPYILYNKIFSILQIIKMPIEIHAHNDFGMATANTIAAIEAGAEFANVTVNGLGERAGNAALEEVAMALKHIKNFNVNIKTNFLKKVSEYVAEVSGRPIPPNKPIVGKNIFIHESGIHIASLEKNTKTYEAFSPEEVGAIRQIVIGKHSGKKSIVKKFEEYGITLTPSETENILKVVRKKAVKLKRALFDKEVVSIYYELQRNN